MREAWYPEALLEGNREEVDVIDDIHKLSWAALQWVRIDYEVSVKSSHSCQSFFCLLDVHDDTTKNCISSYLAG